MAGRNRVITAGRTGLLAGLLLLVVWLSAGVRFESRLSGPSSASRSLVEAALSRGDYRGAESATRELIASLERNRSSNAMELARARDLLITALLGSGKAGDPLTLSLAQASMDSRNGGPDRLGMAVALHNLADVHFQRGEYQEALSFHETGLKIRAAEMPSGDEAIADSLERLATTQMRMERYDAARQNLERAHVIRTRRTTEGSLALAHTLELIGWLHRYAGDLAAATGPIEDALAMLRRLAPDHPALITTTELQGDVMMLQGDIAAAARTWQSAVSLAERTLGDQHPVISALERRLVYAENALGNRAEGRRRLERALVIAERTRTECDPELIVLINDSAESLVFDGEYVDARRRFARTLNLSERCFGATNSNTATVVFNLAALTAQMGDATEAERLYERAIQTWSDRGSEDGFVAKGLDALADVLETRGALARSRSLLERALAIRRNIRPDHPDVAWTLTNLARVVAASGDLPLALSHLTEATEIYGRTGTSMEPDHLARTISQRGDIQARRGDETRARADFAEALALRERLFGPEHPLTAESRLKLAAADLALGRYDAALTGARKAREDGLAHVKFTVRYLPERRALAYASGTVHGLGLELSLATTAASVAPSELYEAVIRTRSIVLDELAARAHVMTDARPEVAAMQARLNAARQRFANLMLRSMSTDAASRDATLILDAARREREEAEQALAEQSAVFRSQLARADVGFEDVRSSLPAGTALVSFVQFDRTAVSRSSSAPGPQRTSAIRVPSYIAFVLRSGDPQPSIVDLGASAGIDDLIARWRRQLIADAAGTPGADQELRGVGTQLRRRIWDPIAIHTAGVTRVLVIPDGGLNLLPIGALPADSGEYLVERQPVIHYLSAERDVMRPREPLTDAAGLLAIGGPAFGERSSPIALSGLESRRSAPGCPSFESVSFDSLPASRLEAEAITRLWQQVRRTASAQDGARLLTGPAATERAFKELSARKRILHLATHGFFLGDECGAVIGGTRAVGGLTSPANANSRPGVDAIENPLLLSGLALAGANRRATADIDDDDGILTAEEVAALNLEGVEWAVLSACDTGLGKVASGEGVLGLRRAFQVAGVRTVIMSLWAVEDQAAQQWMEALYRARLGDRLDTADAVRKATLTVIADRRAAGRSTHPFYWASFVAAGDWR